MCICREGEGLVGGTVSGKKLQQEGAGGGKIAPFFAISNLC